MTIWFTADSHLGHQNIIKYCNRPFQNVDEMDETIINNWNSVVKPEDHVYHLGDFSFGNPLKYSFRLKGKKFLIKGNHDHRYKDQKFIDAGFEWVKDFHVLTIQDKDSKYGKQEIALFHYAMRTWPKSHFGMYSLFGHSHGKLQDDTHSLSIDIGVDCYNFFPLSYEQVKEIMNKRKVVWKGFEK